MANENKITWKRKPQEQAGNYWFSGKILATAGVNATLSKADIKAILDDLFAFVQQEQGIDYLQVYENSEGVKVWIIDQLTKDQLEGDDYTEAEKAEYNYFTILFPHEY